MDWAQLFLGLAVLVGFAVLKVLVELAWEGLKTRLRRELGNDPAPAPRVSAGGVEPAPTTPPEEKDETAFAGHSRAGGGR